MSISVLLGYSLMRIHTWTFHKEGAFITEQAWIWGFFKWGAGFKFLLTQKTKKKPIFPPQINYLV